MRVAIIQMSDLHITSDKDFIVKEAHTLARAVAAKVNGCNKVVLVITGDIIDKGNVSNYKYAKIMLKNFETEIQKEAQLESWNYIMVPGNHDLDFKMDVPYRDMAMEKVLSTGVVQRNEFERDILMPQKAFWAFYSEVTGKPKEPCVSFEEKVAVNESCSIVFHCYNTAFLSTIDEKPQSLIVPEANFISNDDTPNDKTEIVVSVYHHKTGWLSTRGDRNNSHEFSEHIQKQSQIIMCGHEHQHSHKRISDIENKDTILYLESDSLQQGNEQSFSLLVIDDEDLTVVGQTIINLDAISGETSISEEKMLGLPQHEHSFTFSESYYKSLHSIEAPIKHPHKDPLLLNDVYIYPDLEPTNANLDDDSVYAYVDAQELLNIHGSGKIIILEGESQCGKSALLKMYSQQCYYRSIYPVLIHGKDIENINVRSLVVKAYNQQYNTSSKPYSEYEVLERGQRILFIDNMDRSRLNNSGKRELWTKLLEVFDRVVVTTTGSVEIDRMLPQKDEERIIYSYIIHSLGYVKRNELIEKWVLLGADSYCIDQNKTAETIKTVYDQITNILGKQLLPSNPIFLLTLLQKINIDSLGFDVAPTSYAALYDCLLSAALIKAGVDANKVPGYTLFLSELSYAMYVNQTEVFSDNEMPETISFCQFYNSYEKEWNPVAGKDILMNNLKKSCVIIEIEPGVYKFSYKYLFFYLTALRIARAIVKEDGKQQIINLCKNLHKENNANILLFLAYLDTSGVLLDEIKFSSMLPFEDLKPITLDVNDELYSRLTELVNSMRADVLNAGVNPHEHRRKLLEKHDSEDRAIQHASASEPMLTQEEIESDKDLVDFRNTMFVTQIMGQIVKNQQETLKKDELTGLIEDAYNSTFRSLSFITQVIENDRKLFIEEITKNPRYTKGIDEVRIKERLNRLLQMVLMKFCLFSFARLSLAVGSSGRGMSEIYDKVADNIGSPAAAIISFTIKTYYGTMKATELKALVNKYKNNPVVIRLINARVRNYVYNHELPYNRLSELGSITGMQLVDSTSVALAKKNRGK